MRGSACQHSDTPSPVDCAKSAGPRDRRRDCSVLTKNGTQFAPNSVNREFNKSAHGRAADQFEGGDGHHVGLDRRLPSHGRILSRNRRATNQRLFDSSPCSLYEDYEECSTVRGLWTPPWTPVSCPATTRNRPRARSSSR